MILSIGADFEILGWDTSTSVLSNGRFGAVRSQENIRKYEKHWKTTCGGLIGPMGVIGLVSLEPRYPFLELELLKGSVGLELYVLLTYS